MREEKIFLLGRERVAIIKSNAHTYNVRLIKRNIFMEVKKELVRTWVPPAKKTPKPSTDSTKKPKNSQTRLDM